MPRDLDATRAGKDLALQLAGDRRLASQHLVITQGFSDRNLRLAGVECPEPLSYTPCRSLAESWIALISINASILQRRKLRQGELKELSTVSACA